MSRMSSHQETKLILYEKFSCLVVWLIHLPRGRRRRNAKQFLGEFDGLKCCRRRDSAGGCVACRHRGHCRYLYTQHIILTIQSGHAARIIQLQPYTCYQEMHWMLNADQPSTQQGATRQHRIITVNCCPGHGSTSEIWNKLSWNQRKVSTSDPFYLGKVSTSDQRSQILAW